MPQFSPYCAQCRGRIVENSDHLCWFEHHFCDNLCLQKFNDAQLDQSCAQCKSTVSTAAATSGTEQDILLLKSSHGNLIFCDSKCWNQYQDQHVLCAYCTIEVPANTSQSPNEATCEKSVEFCSMECEQRMNIHLNMESQILDLCSNCDQLKFIEMGLFVDGVQYVACSEDCFMQLQQKHVIENDVCHQCMRPFDGENNGTFVISEKLACKVFCSDACMVFCMLNGTKAQAKDCLGCGTKTPYYHTVRSPMHPNQVWCSVQCYLNSKSDLDTEMVVQADKTDQGNGKIDGIGRYEMDCDVNNNAGSPVTETIAKGQSKIVPLSKHETQKLMEQRKMNSIRRCVACNSKISTVGSFLRWHSMEFCNSNCLNEVLERNHAAAHHRCWECDTQIKISNLFVYMEYIEAELRSFCSEKCLVACMDATPECKYCRKALPADGNVMDFCSNCKKNYKRIAAGSTESTPSDDHFCTDCQQRGPISLHMLYNGLSYPFCSLACISNTQTSCGIYADSCVQCNNYFVQNTAEHFTVFLGTKANLLCSKVCRFHFIQQNESLVSCSFCNESNFDLYSLQMIDQQEPSQHTSPSHHFCSVSCFELFVESKSECMDNEDDCAVDGNGQEVNDLDHEMTDQNIADDNGDDDLGDALIFKTISTQTDELIIKCTCTSESTTSSN